VGVLLVLVERRAPGHLLRGEVDLQRADELGDRGKHLARHRAHRAVRCQRDPARPAAAVLDDCLV
jgi:hypothetical protein